MATAYLNLTTTTMEDMMSLEDIMSDILCRLSIKEIIYCKSVCKKCRNLISNSSCFAYLHLSTSSRFLQNNYIFHDFVRDDGRTPGVLKWLIRPNNPTERNTTTDDDDDSSSLVVRTLNLGKAALYGLFPYSRIKVAGSVDGLICVWSRAGTTYVFNPTLSNEYISLPRHHDINLGNLFWMFPMLSQYAMFGCGFGVSSKRVYKVVSILIYYPRGVFSIHEARAARQPIEILVFTLGTNLWRRITTSGLLDDDVVPYGRQSSGLYFNFHLHWIVNDSRILAFQLDTETFKLFSSPPIPTDHEEEENSILGVINGCLSCFCWFPDGFTAWVMKKHGINHSWYKFADVNHSVPYPLCLANGLSMFVDRGELKAYCLETNAFKTVNITPDVLVRIITYHPSFLNLHNFVSDTVVAQSF